MVTVYRFYVYFKLQSKSGKLYNRKFVSAPFATYDIAIAALRSWSRFQEEYYADSGTYFEVVNYFVESTIEELSIYDLYCLSDCLNIKEYGYASEYWLPF